MNVLTFIFATFSALLIGGAAGWFFGVFYEQRKTQKTQDAVRDVFKLLAAEELEKSRSKLAENAENEKKAVKEAISDLVKPLSERLTEFNKERQETYGKVSQTLEHVTRSNAELQKETHNLVSALRRPEVRGKWGEITLRRVVELAGMSNHVDFSEQVVAEGDSRLRPDMVISMPNGHCVVVDAKVAQDAYLTACQAAEKDDRDAALEKHAKQMKDHMMKLSQKEYWKTIPDTADFVIMFVPGDAFLIAALECNNTLIEDALQRKVIIATPSTLMAVLRTIEMGWRHLTLQENARQISEEGTALYSRLRTFINHLNALQKKLTECVGSFNNAVGSYERRVLPGLRHFKDLGANDGEELAELSTIEEPLRIFTVEDEDE